ncbi:hypothetical protein GE061_002862 [Apolygus lucorum]|uniref:Major facilitator superfamily (MFS) profile domain-containing protein n=1 Tax=Apolygus lucorum TaxID=248454 RepID=A0A8S9X603_APOLU|nr:hypothetical protein GE061_002862 [Apolygus lucorum]
MWGAGRGRNERTEVRKTTSNIRKFNCILYHLECRNGILMSSIVGNELTYKNYNATLILVPVIFFSLSFCVPESPFFLFDQSRKEDAFKSLLWLRGNNQKSVQEAIQSMELAHANRVPETSFKSIFTSPGLRRATLIGLFLFSCQIFSGYSIIFSYDEIIFQKIGSPMSVGYSSIVVSSVTLVSSFFGVITVDICGRKPLLYAGFSVGFISMSILSIYLFMTNEEWDEGSWVPFACMIVFVFGYGLGTNLIPQLTTTEIVPSHMRPKILGMLMIVYCILVAIVLQSFPLLDESVGLYGVFLLSSIVNLVGIVGTWYVVPETKSKSHVAMANDLNR